MISFIVPYLNGLKIRPEITKDFLEMMELHLNNNFGIECIVADYGSDDGIEERLESSAIKYIYTEPNEGQGFNTSKCLNHAASKAQHSIIIPMSIDLRFPQQLINYVIDFFRLMGDVILRPNCIMLDKEQRGIEQTNSPYITTRKIVMNNHGWDERMHGWGKEDDDFLERCLDNLNILIFSVIGIHYQHIWHPPSEFKKINNEEWDAPNLKIALQNKKDKGVNVVNSYW